MNADSGAAGRIPRTNGTDEWASRLGIPLLAGTVLDTAAEPVDGVTAYPTRYVASRLLISTLRGVDEAVALLATVAEPLGWELIRDESFVTTPVAESDEEKSARQQRLAWAGGELGIVRVIIRASSRAQRTPDAWVLVQRARREYGIDALHGVGLDHVLTISSPFGMTPFGMTPFGMTPFGMTPFGMTSHGSAIASYVYPGSGGRQPVAFAGEAPRRTPDAQYEGRRAVVGTLDTGCGAHPWLDTIVETAVGIDGNPIGLTDPLTDPEVYGDQFGPLDGDLDSLAGHGTFIAGLIRQAAPDADIVAWRVCPSDGSVAESEVLRALTSIAELVRRNANGETGGLALDVFSLSMGYYHETPTDSLLCDSTLHELLTLMGRCGTIIVCSAGNDATARPMFPAAFGPWSVGAGPFPQDSEATAIVSVGALNPNRSSVALFSNTGNWVRVYERGAAVLSTMPAFQEGLMPAARTVAHRHERESIDPDDYQGGFAVWSGTSFAAPLIAGALAAGLSGNIPLGADLPPSQRVDRAWKVMEKVTPLVR
ncbi:MAG: S8 family peptidase [Rhodoglobus sp.]